MRLRVCHPMNTGGTTWLRESELVFRSKRPYVVLGSVGKHRELPDVLIPLNPKMLKHDRDGKIYRYEGEISDPAASSPASPRRTALD
jgi:hypothetical protein